jgi:hypothetical protein
MTEVVLSQFIAFMDRYCCTFTFACQYSSVQIRARTWKLTISRLDVDLHSQLKNVETKENRGNDESNRRGQIQQPHNATRRVCLVTRLQMIPARARSGHPGVIRPFHLIVVCHFTRAGRRGSGGSDRGVCPSGIYLRQDWNWGLEQAGPLV